MVVCYIEHSATVHLPSPLNLQTFVPGSRGYPSCYWQAEADKLPYLQVEKSPVGRRLRAKVDVANFFSF
ncbi:hypothetical protein GN956_G11273 [Arapaima gigas]